MATNELIRKLTELADLRKMAEDLNSEIEAIQEEIKNHMTAEETDTITAGQFKVTWKEEYSGDAQQMSSKILRWISFSS